MSPDYVEQYIERLMLSKIGFVVVEGENDQRFLVIQDDILKLFNGSWLEYRHGDSDTSMFDVQYETD